MIYQVFAYGSNLDFAQMQNRCHSARVLDKAVLRGYELIFPRTSSSDGRRCADGAPGGVASITETGNTDDVIEGVIYEISGEEDLARLDRWEGVNSKSYYRQIVAVELGNGTRLDCVTYVANLMPGGPFLPSATYKELIVNGARNQGLSKSYQAKLGEIATC